MEKILTKEEAIVMILEKIYGSTERLIVESAIAVIYKHGVKDGLLQAHRTLAGCTGVTRTCPCLVCRSVRADERQDRYDGEGA